MNSGELEPVQRNFVINASQARAFECFTARMDEWWPRALHIGAAEIKRVVLEPREGGRWFEVGIDGSETPWGKVLAWNPTRGLVLAWQLTADWQYDPKFSTEVEVNFVEQSPDLVRFAFEHRQIERYGPKAEDTWNALDSESGWGAMLRAYAAVAERK